MPRGGLRKPGPGKTLGRNPIADKRQPLPFRLKAELVEKCRDKGRDWLEKLIEEAKD